MHSTTRPSNGNAGTNGKTGHGRPTVKRFAEDMMFPIAVIIAFVSVMVGDSRMYELIGDRMYTLGVICANVATILVAWYSRRVPGALVEAFRKIKGRLAVLLMEPTESNRDRCAELYRQIYGDWDMVAGTCKALAISYAVAYVSLPGALVDIILHAGQGLPAIMEWSISVLFVTCGFVFATSLAYLSIRAFLRDATGQGARGGYPALMRKRAQQMLEGGATMDEVAERLDVSAETLRHLLATDGMAGGNGHTEVAGTTDDAKDGVTATA